MEIIRLPSGEHAPVNADCISVFPDESGGFTLNGTALLACGDTNETESISLIGGPSYRTREEAEAAGQAWAPDQCVTTLYVSDVPFSME